ncbi:glycosyl hydrolase [Sphingopyxis sp.]|uniref:glycosyl hydrolase n=1 Tax=Sphingopyxis sp. TaxID=1908224 RepID=UPI002DF0D540|nr:glycosyl hydrolase [Sphingopyxis sp.]
MNTNRALALLLAGATAGIWAAGVPVHGKEPASVLTEQMFRDPPPVYRPIATLSTTVVPEEAADKVRRALEDGEYGSFMFSPSRDPVRAEKDVPVDIGSIRRGVALQDKYPECASQWLPKALPGEAGLGTFLSDLSMALPSQPIRRKVGGPGFWTPEYVATIRETLDIARRGGRLAVFYDEAGYPSGIADHTAPLEYRRKVLKRTELAVAAGQSIDVPVEGVVQAISAHDVRSGRRIDLRSNLTSGRLEWHAPKGDWKLEIFSLVGAKPSGIASDAAVSIDPMDPVASSWFIKNSYDRMNDAFKPYVGSVIFASFFDDVGIYSFENSWSPGIAARFTALTGRDPAPYYAALWRDIGPETQAARVAFFKARAQLLGEGLPKLATDWARAHGVQAMGHPPGNYDPQPTDMNGDPFSFFAHTDVPLADVIFGHGFGRDGFKLMSSVASLRDLPVAGAEVFSASATTMGYRRLIELYVRGLTRFVVTPFLTRGAIGEQRDFARWAGRSSMLLQGGRHVADIAIVYPIESLQAFYSFDAPGNAPPLPYGNYISQDTDYQAVGGMLVDELHRDFTFVDPEHLRSPKLKVEPGALVVDNKVNRERYQIVILPGGEVLSVAALTKIKAFHDAGGTVIATSRLPFKSAEFGKDKEVRALVRGIFGLDPAAPMPEGVTPIRANRRGGKTVFVPKPSAAVLADVFDRLGAAPDVAIDGNPSPRSGNGVFGYIHRQKEGKEIYFFGNSSDTPLDTMVELRGRVNKPQIWDPHSGTVAPATEVSYQSRGGVETTRLKLKVGAISGQFVVGELAD